MLIIPAIDLLGGNVVRLRQGRENSAKVYSDNPVETALSFQKAGARLIHVVDLDGAFGRPGQNDVVIREMADALSIPMELGGGIRSLDRVGYWLNRGVTRIILGSAAVKNPDLIRKAVQKYSNRSVIAGVDIRDNRVSVSGWQEDTAASGLALAREMVNLGLSQIIVTEIATDGMLTGPRLESMKEIAERTGLHVIASGGIGAMEDLKQVADTAACGIRGIIVGRAIYENKVALEDAIQQFQGGENWIL